MTEIWIVFTLLFYFIFQTGLILPFSPPPVLIIRKSNKTIPFPYDTLMNAKTN